MPLRATTVRFSEDLWNVLHREATAQGLSAAQLVRDATLLRLAFLMAARGDAESQATIQQVATAAAAERAPAVGSTPVQEVAPRPPNPRRMEALRRAGLLDSRPEPEFDRLARIAAQVLNAPVALVSIVTEDTHRFKSCVGLPSQWADAGHLPMTHSFCQHTVAAERPLIVGDAREHPLLKDSPAIVEMEAIAYAGVPLITSDGAALGTLCVIDREPRVWTRDQVGLLVDLAATVVREVETRSRQAARSTP